MDEHLQSKTRIRVDSISHTSSFFTTPIFTKEQYHNSTSIKKEQYYNNIEDQYQIIFLDLDVKGAVTGLQRL